MLAPIARNSEHLADIFDPDNATNDRLLAENELLPGIGIEELVFRIPYASIINAAFTHAHPLGSRFNAPDRGAWHAAFAGETAQAEVAFHKTVDLAEIDRFEDDVTCDDYLADFKAEFHDLRDVSAFAEYLHPDSYVASQALAERLLASGSLGIVYPSVRRPPKTCIACFRPALVTNVRKGSAVPVRLGGQAGSHNQLDRRLMPRLTRRTRFFPFDFVASRIVMPKRDAKHGFVRLQASFRVQRA